MHRIKKTLIATSVAALLSACSIKPETIKPTELASVAHSDQSVLTEQVEPITGAIGLEEAIARALKNNRDRKLKALEAALAQRQTELVRHEMLPSLAASAGYSERSNYAGSASVTFTNGVPDPLGVNPTYSVSQEKERTTYDAVFTWNMLDFGLSYVRAKQHADRYLIARERERKVVHNISQEVRAAYWRAVSAGRMLQKIGPLSVEAAQALDKSREVEKRRLRSPIEALYYQRDLLDILRSLQTLRQDLVNAKIELAGLMGLKPGTQFELADVANPEFDIPVLSMQLDAMEEKALTNRPELVEAHYQKRISAAETRAALLKILPGISLNAGTYKDENLYLLNQDWTSIGAQVSWNLLDVFKLGTERDMAKTREALAEEQRLATSMAVLTQVHLAKVRFEQSRKTYDLAESYLDVASRIQQQSLNAAKSKRSSELDTIRDALNTLLAELRRDVAFAELQNSYGKLFVTMGMDLVPEGYAQTGSHELSQKIDEKLTRWQRGEIEQPGVPERTEGVMESNADDDTVESVDDTDSSEATLG